METVWQRSPAIKPNYRRRKGLLPKSSINQVLLHDNTSQQHLLDLTLSHIRGQERRVRRLLELHRKSFLTSQSLKQQELRTRGIRHISFLPEAVAEAHCRMAQYGHSGSPHKIKTLPLAKRISELRRQHEGQLEDNTEPARESADLKLPVPGPHVVGKTHRLTELTEAMPKDRNIPLPLLDRSKTPHRSHSAFPKVKFKDEITRTFATYQNPIERAKTFVCRSEKKSRNRSLNDPRFLRLQDRLQPPDPSSYTDSFLELSECGKEVIDRSRPLLLAWQQRQNENVTGKSPELLDARKKTNLFKLDLVESLTSLQFSSDTDDDEDR